jgi:hypothetical protein
VCFVELCACDDQHTGLCSVELCACDDQQMDCVPSSYVPLTISTNKIFTLRLLFKENIVSMSGVSVIHQQ